MIFIIYYKLHGITTYLEPNWSLKIMSQREPEDSHLVSGPVLFSMVVLEKSPSLTCLSPVCTLQGGLGYLYCICVSLLGLP